MSDPVEVERARARPQRGSRRFVEVEQEVVGVGRSDAQRLACLGWEVVDVEGDGSVLSPGPFSVVFNQLGGLGALVRWRLSCLLVR